MGKCIIYKYSPDLPSSLAAIQYLSVHSCSIMKVDIVSLESDGGVYAVKRYFVEN